VLAWRLKDPETEWMLVRYERRLYVGDSLRNLNEYISVGVPNPNLIGYGTAREFSHADKDGNHLHLCVRRRGDKEKEMVLVFTLDEIAEDFKDWAKLLRPFDN
jgi:hypothetical protein